MKKRSLSASMRLFALVLGTILSVAASQASAEVILFSIGFTDLDGTWDMNTSVFTAMASDTGGLQSGGDVTRQINPMGSAEFDAGFLGLGTFANFEMTMILSDVTSDDALVKPGDGRFTITDADGDQITGMVEGTWLPGAGGILYFDGLVTDVTFSDLNTTFDGPSSGSFSTDFSPADPPYEGGVILLSISGHDGFFDEGDFAQASTLISAQVVPSPASLALIGLGLIGILGVSGRRGRRFARFAA